MCALLGYYIVATVLSWTVDVDCCTTDVN